jgi:hypothetical protein
MWTLLLTQLLPVPAPDEEFYRSTQHIEQRACPGVARKPSRLSRVLMIFGDDADLAGDFAKIETDEIHS